MIPDPNTEWDWGATSCHGNVNGNLESWDGDIGISLGRLGQVGQHENGDMEQERHPERWLAQHVRKHRAPVPRQQLEHAERAGEGSRHHFLRLDSHLDPRIGHNLDFIHGSNQ